MDFETVSAASFGQSLHGIGLNILVTDVKENVAFLNEVFDAKAHRVSKDFAIITYGQSILQIHADHTYAENILLGLVPENPPRGAGMEIRLYNTDPDDATKRAKKFKNVQIYAEPMNKKPHGLREAIILGPDGYAWLPSRVLTKDELL